MSTTTGADPIQGLVHALSRLPGIGQKTAQRLAFFILEADHHVAAELAQALIEVKARVHLCSICCNLTEEDPCRFCTDPRRDAQMICVVSSVPSLLAIEATGDFRGRYHVLHGVLAPLEGVGPESLHLKELMARLGGVQEVIVATNPSVEGEATALYIQRLIGPLGVEVTRIASGVPMGADLEYADVVTLARALQGRRVLG